MKNIINFKNDIYDEGISVIIPFYKNLKWLMEALNSVNKQSLQPNEIIIVNDGSREDLSLLNLSDKYIIVNQSNQGAAIARNVGISLSHYRYIAFLDSDDIWHPDKLKIQSSIMKQTGSMWSFHKYNIFNDFKIPENLDEQIIAKYIYIYIYPNILNSCLIATPSVMLDRRVFENYKLGFNANLKYGEDISLWIQLAHLYPVVQINNHLCYVRMHGNNASKNIFTQLSTRRNLWQLITENGFDRDTYLSTKISYSYCLFLENKIKNSSSSIKRKLYSRLYLFPRILLKISYYFHAIIIKKLK